MFHRWILPLVGFGLVLFAGEFTMAMASDEQKKKSLKGVKRQKELWYSELRGSLLNHNKYVLSEHIFINIIIKLTLKRYCKYRKENEYRERKTHQNKQKKGTSESSRPLITTSDPNQSQTSVTVQTEKGVKPKKQLSLQLYSIHTAKCLLLMFSLTMALKPETVHEKWHYILKKNNIKQCENSDQLQTNWITIIII